MEKIITDLHMHSHFSPDASAPLEVLCRAAAEKHLTTIAITDHAEWHHQSQQYGFPLAEDYFAAIEACRMAFSPVGLTVLSGIELGNPHQFTRKAKNLLDAWSFDIVIASIHWLNGHNIHHATCFAGKSPDEVYIEYFLEIGRLAAAFDFDILAHFDRIFWQGTQLGAPLNAFRLEKYIRYAFDIMVRYNRVLELNTKFLGTPNNWNDTLITLLRWYRDAGGTKIVVNSDAHQPAEIGRNFALAEKLLPLAGFSLPESLFVPEPIAISDDKG